MTIESYEQAVLIAQNFELRQIWSEVIENASKFVGLFTNQQYIDFINFDKRYQIVAKIIINTAIGIDDSVITAFANKFKNEFTGINLGASIYKLFYEEYYDFDFENFAKFIKYFAPTDNDMQKILIKFSYQMFYNTIKRIYETE